MSRYATGNQASDYNKIIPGDFVNRGNTLESIFSIGVRESTVRLSLLKKSNTHIEFEVEKQNVDSSI